VKRWRLLCSTALLLAGCLAFSPPSWADECGTGTSVTCTPAGNDYASGIAYFPATDLTMIVEDGVTINSGSNDGIKVDYGIHAKYVTGGVSVELTDSGSIATSGNESYGIFIERPAGDANLRLYDSDADFDITTTGTEAHGIIVQQSNFVEIFTEADISASGANSYGIYIDTAYEDVVLSLSGSAIRTSDSGISINGAKDDARVVLSNGSSITTTGSSAAGIQAFAAGDVWVSLSELDSITTYGFNSFGINISSQGTAEVELAGDVTTGKNFAATPAVNSFARGISITYSDRAKVNLTDTGSITTYGAKAHGIQVSNTGDISTDYASVSVSGDIITNGDNSHGVYWGSIVNTKGDVAVNIGGNVEGGSGTGAGVYLNNPSAQPSTLTIESGGKLGALSDLAIKSLDPALTINNAGEITGYLTLGDNTQFNNSGTWYLRNGSSPAIADFGGDGSTDNDSFINKGVLSLLKDMQTTWQGQLVNLESFTNSSGGLIDLGDGYAGDTLFISGKFVSDGGMLELDVVLDDGAAPQADVLYLETVSVAGGPTRIVINNIGGVGGQTSGSGIQIIDVDDQGTSPSNAFVLSERVIAGAYEYALYHDAATLDWYLKSSALSDTGEYPALVSGALLSWLADIPALHNRLHDLRWTPEDDEPVVEPAAWTSQARGGLRPWFHVAGTEQKVGTLTPFDLSDLKLAGGIDGEIVGASGMRALFGAFAGTGRYEQDLRGSSSEAAADVALAGVYAGFRQGGFYGDAILKYEHHWAKFRSASTLDEETPVDADILGASLEAGYRVTMGRFYAQPHGRLTYAHIKAGEFEDGSGISVDLKDAGLLGSEAATRIGANLGETFLTDLHVDAGVRHLSGETEAETSGLSFTHDLPGTVGFVGAGMRMRVLQDKLFLSLDGSYAKGEEAEELAAALSVTINR
jgi:hypothetical protein